MAKYEKWLSEDGLNLLRGWARDGLTYEQMCEKMSISESTFREWRKKFPIFAQVIAKGQEIIDRQVEESLLKRALGFEFTEVTQELVGSELKVTKTVKKYVPPDTTAVIFWLKNRKPEAWRNHPEYIDNSQLNRLDDILSAIKEKADNDT